jgi:IS30 family transposase
LVLPLFNLTHGHLQQCFSQQFDVWRCPYEWPHWVDPRRYRMNRKLSLTDRTQLAEQYRVGMSALELAREYKMHRQTVMRHLEREGVTVRRQLKMTPQLVDRAKKLYAQGQTLVMIGKQLGVEASTLGKALKRAGVTLRPPVADRRRKSRDA